MALRTEHQHILDQKWQICKGEIDECKIIVGVFDTSLSEVDRSSRQEIIKDLVEFNNTLSQLDIIEVYRQLHPTTDYTGFSSLHKMFTKRDRMLCHKTHLNKFNKINILTMPSNHNRIKLNIYHGMRARKIPKYLEIKWSQFIVAFPQ